MRPSNNKIHKKITATYLTQKPRKDSFWTAMILLGLLLLINFLAWQWPSLEMSKFLSSRQTALYDQETWRLITSPLLHSDFKHLSSNLLMLTPLTFLIYGYHGMSSLLTLFLPITWLTQYLTLIGMPENVSLLGSSGTAYAMCAFWLVLYGFIDRRRTVAKRLFP